MRKIPRWAYGAERDGLLDPDRFDVEQRAELAPETLAEEDERRHSASPVVRRFQALADKALGRRR